MTREQEYDAEIERLCAVPDHEFVRTVNRSWTRCDLLFQFLTPDGSVSRRDDQQECGCPTMVKANHNVGPVAYTDELTAFVRSLPLPTEIDNATKEGLVYFKQAQMEADRLLNRG